MALQGFSTKKTVSRAPRRHPHQLNSRGPWSTSSLWIPSHARCWTKSWSLWKNRGCWNPFQTNNPNPQKWSSSSWRNGCRSLENGCRQQVTCAHPPSLSPMKSLRPLFKAWFENHRGKGSLYLELDWMISDTYPGLGLRVWLDDCRMPHHIWQSEPSGECGWTFLKGSLGPGQNMSFGVRRPGSQSWLWCSLALWFRQIISPNLTFLSFTMGRITSSSTNHKEGEVRCLCCLCWDETVLLTQTFSRSSCLVFRYPFVPWFLTFPSGLLF